MSYSVKILTKAPSSPEGKGKSNAVVIGVFTGVPRAGLCRFTMALVNDLDIGHFTAKLTEYTAGLGGVQAESGMAATACSQLQVRGACCTIGRNMRGLKQRGHVIRFILTNICDYKLLANIFLLCDT